MKCTICERRPQKRFCPAKGEKICAPCCGTGREVSIDCTPDCSYLLAAHRYEAAHRQALSPDAFPYPDIDVPLEFMYEHWRVVAAIAGAVVSFQIQRKDLNDQAARLALEALAETYRTLGTGIYYERPPDAPLARALYAHIAEFLEEFRKREINQTGFTSLRDSDIFLVLVFLLRTHKRETSGRPLSRSFLAFLAAKSAGRSSPHEEESRIIVS
ncbi:MAG TPA: hypothetical protein VEJ67_14960 [Candidatus Cybelea sp.]|nr:hypothetical protein [Candidatus Cybelea sp.]